MKTLSQRLATYAAEHRPDPDLFILRGAASQKRADWNGASDLLIQGVAALPDSNNLLYEAALNSVDGSLYLRAEGLLKTLCERRGHLTDGQLRELWRASSLIGLHELARLAFDEALGRDYAPATAAIGERMVQAQAYGREQRANPVAVISIGENCFPWMVMNRWGVRSDALSPAADCIFNLAQSSTDGCASIVAAAGADLMETNDLEGVIKADGATPLPTNVRYGIEFNHEQGDDWIIDAFAKLKARYIPRMANFSAALSGAPRVFVHYTENPGDLDRMAGAVRSVNADDRYRLVIIDASHLDRTVSDADVDYVRVRRPRDDYIWYRPDDLESLAGIAFEREAADRVIAAVRRVRNA